MIDLHPVYLVACSPKPPAIGFFGRTTGPGRAERHRPDRGSVMDAALPSLGATNNGAWVPKAMSRAARQPGRLRIALSTRVNPAAR